MSDDDVNDSTLLDAKTYSIYDKTVQDSVRNIVFIVPGTLFLYWLAGMWLLGAKILFYLFAAMTAFTVLSLLYKTLGLLLLIFSPYAKAIAPDWMKHGKGWLVGATVMRWIEAVIGSGAIWFLYTHIWKH